MKLNRRSLIAGLLGAPAAAKAKPENSMSFETPPRREYKKVQPAKLWINGHEFHGISETDCKAIEPPGKGWELVRR